MRHIYPNIGESSQIHINRTIQVSQAQQAEPANIHQNTGQLEYEWSISRSMHAHTA